MAEAKAKKKKPSKKKSTPSSPARKKPRAIVAEAEAPPLAPPPLPKPSYPDGTLVLVGDVVQGETHNKPGTVIGIVVKVKEHGDRGDIEIAGRIRVVTVDEQRQVTPVDDHDYGEAATCKKIV